MGVSSRSTAKTSTPPEQERAPTNRPLIEAHGDATFSHVNMMAHHRQSGRAVRWPRMPDRRALYRHFCATPTSRATDLAVTR